MKKSVIVSKPKICKPLSGLDINVSDCYPFDKKQNRKKFKDDQKSRILKYLPITSSQWDRQNSIDMDHHLDAEEWIIDLFSQFQRTEELFKSNGYDGRTIVD